MNTAENLKFNYAMLRPTDKSIEVAVGLYGAETYVFGIKVDEWPLNRQASSMAQILDQLSQVFSPVERLTLRRKVLRQSSEEVDRIEWRRLLRSFNNVKILRVEDRGIVKELSRHGCLQSEDGELPLELFPELQELTYYGSGDSGNAFASFTEARRHAGRPVTLIRHGP